MRSLLPSVSLLLLLLLNGVLLGRAALPKPEPEPETPPPPPDPVVPVGNGGSIPNSGSHPGIEDPPLPAPNVDPTVPHAAVIPDAKVVLPEHPSSDESKEEEEDSKFGEILEKVADAINEIVDKANGNGGGSSSQTAISTVAVARRDGLDEIASMQSNTNPPQTTAPPPQASGCLFANEVYSSCANTFTTDVSFVSLLQTDQASCLCYATASGSWYWQPSSFDGYMTSCASYVATQNFSSSQAATRAEISSGLGFCSRAGDVRTTAVVAAAGSGSATSKTTVTPSTSTIAPMTSPIAPVKTGMATRLRSEIGPVATMCFSLLIFVMLV